MGNGIESLIETGPETDQIGNRMIRNKIVTGWIQTIFPFFVFLLVAGSVAYALYEPDLMRTITCGIFFVFGILIIHRAKLLWKQ